MNPARLVHAGMMLTIPAVFPEGKNQKDITLRRGSV
jgi:hypothetical protein